MKRRFTNFAGLAMIVLMTVAFSSKVEAAPYCMNDIWGYVWHMNVTPAGGGIFNISGTVDVVEWPNPGALSGTYNRNTNTATLTVTNPTPDGCVAMSGSFTITGSRSGGTLSGTWTNDCGGSGTHSGSLSKGACRVAPGGQAIANGPGAGLRETATLTSTLAPNPASDMVAINYAVTNDQHVQVTVTDLTGRTVAVLVDEQQTAGTYRLNWNVGNAADGIYLVRINDQVEKLSVRH